MIATKLFLAVALVAASLASPAICKRSFKAASPSRQPVKVIDEMNRTRRKYGGRVNALDCTASIAIISTISFTSSTSFTSSAHTARTPPPSTASITTTGEEDGEVKASPDPNNVEYLSPVTIGSTQQLILDFDTGSSDLWVYTPDTDGIGSHTAFNPNKSSTWTDLPGATFEIRYGDGTGVSGTVGFDTVDLGGSTVTKQCVELATHASSTFLRDENLDGLLGLAFGKVNSVEPHQQSTFFENVMDDLTLPLFTVNLEGDTGEGTYEFGTIDSSKYSGDIHYATVNSSGGFWQISTPSYSIGQKSSPCKECSPSIVDTGTTLLLMDEDVVQAYYKQVHSAELVQGFYVFLCNATNVPDFGIMIGDSGFTATIPGGKMSLGRLDKRDKYYPGYCVGGLQIGGFGFQILGDAFLKHFFAVFDGGNERFGIAEQD